MEETSKKMKRGDFIMLLVAGVVAAGLFFWRLISNRTAQKGEAIIAKIERNGKTIKEINLDKIKETENIVLEDDGLKVTILAEPGRICFLESECRDQICVNTGWLTKQGDVAACLPAKTIVSIF